MGRLNMELFFPLTSDGESYDIFLSNVRNIKNVSTQKVIEVAGGMEYNLPGIAHAYMGDKSFWWVILMFNGLQDPVGDIVSGLKLKIPNKSEIMRLLESDPLTTLTPNASTRV